MLSTMQQIGYGYDLQICFDQSQLSIFFRFISTYVISKEERITDFLVVAVITTNAGNFTAGTNIRAVP